MKNILAICIFAMTSAVFAADNIKLPEPVKTGGVALRDALANRQSNRDFADTGYFTNQQISDLLWAASGINRPDGRMTSPTASDSKEIDLYVALPTGAYLYNRAENTLEIITDEDVRAATGLQPFVGKNTLEIVIVGDHAKIKGDEKSRENYIFIDSGYVSQNLYLLSAAEGYNTVVRAYVPKEKLAAKLKLRPDQQITVTQTVGLRK